MVIFANDYYYRFDLNKQSEEIILELSINIQIKGSNDIILSSSHATENN